MAFFELRQYRTKPGKREEWLKFMDEVIIPYQVSKGMIVTGSFAGETEEDLYVWLRRFESEEERERLYQAVYENDYWRNEVSPKVGQMIDRKKIIVTRIEPTPRSLMR